MPAELTILLLNTVLIVVCYQLLYPRHVGNSRVRLIINDAIATVVALMVAGSVYVGSGQLFSLLVVDVSWFWFTLVSYSLMELPFAMRYMRRHNMLE
jgi:hypothetical protein